MGRNLFQLIKFLISLSLERQSLNPGTVPTTKLALVKSLIHNFQGIMHKPLADFLAFSKTRNHTQVQYRLQQNSEIENSESWWENSESWWEVLKNKNEKQPAPQIKMTTQGP